MKFQYNTLAAASLNPPVKFQKDHFLFWAVWWEGVYVTVSTASQKS